MKGVIAVEETFQPGNNDYFSSISSVKSFGVVFEDDGQTGYFYALDTTDGKTNILDAVSIYDVENVTDLHIPSVLNIVWSPDGQKAALFINRYPHAIFDFASKRGYCRRNFPEPNQSWTAHSHEWSEDALALFD